MAIRAIQQNKNMKTRHLPHAVLILSMAAISPSAFAQEQPKQEKPTGDTAVETIATVLPGTLTTVISDSASFSTLTQAIKAADLDLVLGGRDSFTIFAPTDEAFGKLPDGTLTMLLLPENKEKLRMLLLYHVVAGKVLAADVVDGEVKTVNGEKLKFDVSPDKIEVDGAKVYSADVLATNGVMHSLGEVLVPESLDGFAGLKN